MLNKTNHNEMNDSLYNTLETIANGNTENLYKLFATLTIEAKKSGLSTSEAKREAKVILNIMADAYAKANSN